MVALFVQWRRHCSVQTVNQHYIHMLLYERYLLVVKRVGRLKISTLQTEFAWIYIYMYLSYVHMRLLFVNICNVYIVIFKTLTRAFS